MLKKSLSFVLTCIMIISVFTILPLSASAEETEIIASPDISDETVSLLPTQTVEETRENDTFIQSEAPVAAVGAVADTEPTEKVVPTEAPEVKRFPMIDSITNTNSGAVIRWKPFEDNTRYRVYYRSENGWTRFANVTGDSCTDKTVRDGMTRIYTIRCVDENGAYTSDFNRDGWQNTYYAAPQIKSLTSTTAGVKLTWDVPEGAEEYRVYRRTKGADWTRLAQFSGSEYTDTTPVSGTSYIYTIRMITAVGEQFMSDYVPGKSITYVAAPRITSIENTENGAVIRWAKSVGAYYYRVYYRNPTGWTKLTQTTATSYTDKSAVNGQKRLYTVRCFDARENYLSDFYRDNMTNTYYAAPEIASLTCTTSGVTVKWDRPQGAEDYRVYRKLPGKSWTRLTQTNESSYTDTTAVSGTTYIYTIRMISSVGEKFMSDYLSGKSIAYVSAPKITGITNAANGAKLTWDKCVGAEKYRVYYRGANGWVRIAEVKGTSYTDVGVSNGETRKYTVRCMNKNGGYASDFYREGRLNTFYAPVTIKMIDKTDGGVSLSWNALDPSDTFVIYRGENGGSRTELDKTVGGEYTDKTAKEGVKYTYSVRMLSQDGEEFLTAMGTEVSFLTCAVPQITFMEADKDGVKLKWNKDENASGYRVYDISGGEPVALGDAKGASFTDKTIKEGETRVYTVCCLNSTGGVMSDYSAEGWRLTRYSAPGRVNVSLNESGQTVVSWDDAGVAGYRLYRKAPGGSWTRTFDQSPATSYVDEVAQKGDVYTYTLRYVEENGYLCSYYFSDTLYYCDGALANGELRMDGNSYLFKDGVLESGFRTVDGKKYYYDLSGALVKNDLVGSDKEGWYFADSKGVCCESEEIRLAADFMARYCKGSTLKEKMKSGFMYMAKNFPYKRTFGIPKSNAEMSGLASDAFKDKAANCYRYAAAFCCLARMAGYRARVSIGAAGTSPHGWTEVFVDGKWLYCDVDANLPTYHVPDYYAYMMTNHCWYITSDFKSELVIEDGEAVWK